MKTSKVLLSVLAGIAAGALAGVLFAPEKGARTRKRILRKGEEYTDDLRDKFNELADTIGKKYEHVLEEGRDLFLKGTVKSNGVKKELKDVAG